LTDDNDHKTLTPDVADALSSRHYEEIRNRLLLDFNNREQPLIQLAARENSPRATPGAQLQRQQPFRDVAIENQVRQVAPL
jgi:hypothetical protein